MATPTQHGLPWLRELNPWWGRGYSMDSDRHIATWEASAARHVPALFYDLRGGLDADSAVLYTIRGSRQVGKTTLTKLLLRDLLAGGTPPECLCYFSLGKGFTIQSLVEIVRTYLASKPPRHRGARSYIFIDEVSMLMDWQYAILELSNAGALDNTAIVATGSNAVDLTRATECLIGRKGSVPGGNHKSLLPMRFLDYAALTSPAIRTFLDDNDLHNVDSRTSLWNSLVSGQEDATLSALNIMSDDLDLAFQNYAASGGIPKIVNHSITDGKVADAVYREYTEGISFEWSRLGYDQHRLKRYADFVMQGIGGTITWNGIAKKLDIANAATAERYAKSLEDMYVLLVSYTYDTHNDRANYPKLKKIHVRDPFFFHALASWEQDHDYHTSSLKFTSEAANLGKLAECAVADHLAKFAITEAGGVMQSGSPERVFHWRDEAGREVDFVYRSPESTLVPIEVKYADRVDGRRLGGIASFVDSTRSGHGIVATRSGYEIRRDYTLIPAPALLLLLS